MKTDQTKQDWGASLRGYACGLVRHWWVYTLPFLFSVFDLLEKLFSLHVPTWFWWCLVLVGLSLAQFLVYHRLRQERDRLRQFEVNHSTLAHLAKMRADLIQHQNVSISSETALGQWDQQYRDKRTAIREYLKENVSEAEAEAYQHIGTFSLTVLGTEYTIKGQPHPVHVQMRSMLIRDCDHLLKLIQDYCRQRGWLSDRLVRNEVAPSA